MDVAPAVESIRGDSEERLRFLDVFRGAAILAAVGIHVLEVFLADYALGSPAWLAVAAMNRALLFAVPAFLMLTALVLTRSLLRTQNLGRYTRRRLQQSLWPYLVWSVPCVLYAYRADPKAFSWQEAAFRLVIGKSYFHLYYLGLALQLSLLLPLLLPLLRRRPSFTIIGPALLVSTLGFYALNRYALHLTYVGSIILWYLPAVLLGVWLGSDTERLHVRLRQGAWVALPLAVLSLAFYLPQALQALQNRPVNTFLFQVGEWMTTTSTAFGLLVISASRTGYFRTGLQPRSGPQNPHKRVPEPKPESERGLKRVCSWSEAALASLGSLSLQIYLAHPLALLVLGRFSGLRHALGFLPAFLLYYGLALLLPLLFTGIVTRLRLSRWVFGR